jgi:hypothetical protein
LTLGRPEKADHGLAPSHDRVYAPHTQGPAGKDAKVTCTVKKKSQTKIKVTCKVTLILARQGALRWRLVHRGRAYEHGVVFARDGRATLRIPAVNRLSSGRYVLRIAGRAGGTVFVIG